MKNFMNILLILICGMMFSCNDNVYEKISSGNGMVIICKDLRYSADVTPNMPWTYKYKVTDYSGQDGTTGNAGDFYYYSSNNFLVGDTLTFTTISSLKKMNTNIKRIVNLETNLLTFISTKNLADSLQITIDNQDSRLLEVASIVDSLLKKAKTVNAKNITLQLKLKDAQVQNSKLRAFKDSLKALTTE